jgi:ketose-bisphosphate aldolase
MPLFPFRAMLDTALANRFAVGYFQAWNEDSLEAVLEAGEEMDAPLVIGFGGTPVNQEWFDGWGIELGAALGRVAAQKARVPVALILNETEKLEQCLKGIELGFNVVMVDSSSLPYGENLRVNRELVERAHPRGVAVEGELGHLPTGGPPEGPGGGPGGAYALTDPDQAREFVAETGIDALSVSVGNVHVLTRGEASIDVDRIARIRDKTGVPLVIHGGTGFPPGQVTEAIRRGVAKFNVGTVLKKVYFEGLKKTLEETSEPQDMQLIVGSRESGDFTMEGKKRVKAKVKELIRLYGSGGKARLF